MAGATGRTAPALALLTLIAGAIGGLASLPADAQTRPSVDTLDQRLERVERVLDRSLLDQLQRIDSLQQELRELRGELERVNNELATMKRREGDLYADTDRRLTELEEASDAGGLFGGAFGGEDGGLDAGLDGGSSGGADGGSGGRGALDAGSPGRFVGSGGVGRASDAALPSGGNVPVEVRTSATQAEQAAYTNAYDLLARGDNDSAVAAFDAFLEDYPDGPYSFNAWYWKGEAMYAERRFDEAIEHFLVVTESFPGTAKVPDAELKIGFSLYEQGDFLAARSILERVRDGYEGRSAAVLARKRLEQMDREGV